MNEHAYSNIKNNQQSAMYEHLSASSHYSHILHLLIVNNHDVDCYKSNINLIKSNTVVLNKANNCKEFLFKEA